MSANAILKIRERHEQASVAVRDSQLHADRAVLLAEIDRLWTLHERLRVWSAEHGAALSPGGEADTFGNGMRRAKSQVSSILCIETAKTEPPPADDEAESDPGVVDLGSCVSCDRALSEPDMSICCDAGFTDRRDDDGSILRRHTDPTCRNCCTCVGAVRHRARLAARTVEMPADDHDDPAPASDPGAAEGGPW